MPVLLSSEDPTVRRRVLVFEDLEKEIRRACQNGVHGSLWPVASMAAEAVPAVCATLVVQHGIVAEIGRAHV